MKQVTVNAVGKQCPVPVVEATRALRAMGEAGVLEVRVDNAVAVENLKRMAGGNRLPVTVTDCGDGTFSVKMEVSEPVGERTVEAEPMCLLPERSGLVVAVDADVMGRGSEELGRTLMKGFLFAVSRLPQLPDTVLFYNSGAKLTVEDSASLEDLREMEAQGVEILTCGTCLNYYGLTERLAVGRVTDMYTIVERLSGSERVVKP